MAHESLVVVRLKSQTGLPADTVEMQFAFQDASENGGPGLSAIAAVDQFLNGTFGAGSLSSFLAGSLDHSADAVEYDIYNISGAALSGGLRGSPILSQRGTLDTPSVDTDLPLQASIGLSYHADLNGLSEFGVVDPAIPTSEAAVDMGAPATHSGTTRPKARHRGRTFFGPLNEAAMSSSAIRIREPDPTFTTVAIAALEFLQADSSHWCVWSRRDAALHRITGGFIAHETDVVRRRRRKATFRTLWP